MPNLTDASKAYHKIYGKKWYIKNRSRLRLKFKRYYQKNKATFQAYAKANRGRYRQWKRSWRAKNLEHARAYARAFYRKNRKKLITAAVDYKRRRLARDPLARLESALRSRVYAAIKHRPLKTRVSVVFGCSPVQLRCHLQSKFKRGMSWRNFGRNGWEIDHIKPCCLFDFSKASEQRACFHFTNLQPLWKAANRAKHRKYENAA